MNTEKCAHIVASYKRHPGITFQTTERFKGHPTFGRGYADYHP